MITFLKALWNRYTAKNTTHVQFESVRCFMKQLGYPSYQAGRFYGEGIAGCSVINYRTAVRLHNCTRWLIVDQKKVAPVFNEHMSMDMQTQRTALKHRIVLRCKQQLVERFNEPTIKTQSHRVKFKDRGMARGYGMM